jgi:uncharacterized repeat protein (TIGR01451 family)
MKPNPVCWALIVGLAAQVARADAAPLTLLEQAFPDVPLARHAVRGATDAVPISPLYACTRGNPNRVQVVFSAAVAPATATNKTNYTIAPAIAVSKAELGGDAYTVILTTATMADTTKHVLTVNNVQDTASPPNLVPPNSQVPILKAQGVITRKVFTGIGGNWLNSLTNNASFPDNPSLVDWPASFEAPVNQGDYYGNQMIGYLWPPVTADYKFYLASDNQGVLYLSYDASPNGKAAFASVPDATGSRQWNRYASQQSEYIHLEAGRLYYLEALMAEATGADCLAVAWRLRGMPGPADGDAPIPGAFLSSVTPSAAVDVGTQPADVTVAEGQSASFSVTASGTPPYTYQWRRDGSALPGATASSYTLANAQATDHGARFSVVISNSFSSVTSRLAQLTVVPDLTPPAVVRVTGSATLNKVRIAFSELLDPLTANNTANYRLGGGLSVLKATLQPDGTNVALTTSLQASGQSYSLTISGVTDRAAAHNALTTTTAFNAWIYCRGFVNSDLFAGIGGGAISDLTNNPAFPDSYASSANLVSLERGNIGDNYGQRLSAWLLPPTTGYYTFFIASDDQALLSLSPDEDPSHLTPIASVPWATGWRNYFAHGGQTSLPVWLQAGRKYYVEALQKEGGGDDYVNVAWQMPGQSAPAAGAPPVPGACLATAADPVGVSLAVTDPANAVVPESALATFVVAVTTSASQVFYQWQRNGVDITGANSATYTTPRLLRAESGAQYQCYVSVPGAFLITKAATVTVTPDNVAPQVVSAATLCGSANLGVCFTELMDPASVTNPANYTLSIAGQVVTATLRPDGRSVSLGVTALGYADYTLQLNNLKDYAGNPLPAQTTVTVAVQPLESTDLGVVGDPIEPGSTFTCRTGAFDVVAGGGDFWGNADRGHFVYQVSEGDFDVAVRVEAYVGASTWSRAGLMARESLAAESAMVNATMFPVTGANRYEAHHRGSAGTGVGAWPGPYQYSFPDAGVPLPNAWVRLTRQASTFTAYASTNGTAWVQFSQISLPLAERLYVGMASSAQNNAPGVVTRIDYRDYQGAATGLAPVPFDLAIKRWVEPDTAYALIHNYQTVPAAGQVLDQPASASSPASFAIRLGNDGGTPQTAVWYAAESSGAGWTVTYRLGATDITAAITSASGYTSLALAPGQPAVLRVDLVPSSRVLGAARKSTLIRVTTEARTRATRDAVLAEAINEVSYQPDLMVRRMDDVLYAGERIYNLSALGQSKQIRVTPCHDAVYAFRLLNAGNLTNTFVLTASAGSSAWVSRYFEGLTGNSDITAELTVGGVCVTLSPSASWEGRVEVAPGPFVPSGDTNTRWLTARSAMNRERADVISMITSVSVASGVPQRAVYTADADFEMGELVGTAYGGDQLTLSPRSVTRPFVWVPNSNEGTVSKVDTRTGNELARYRVCPPGVTGNPSRTTIDQYGNCWVANRQSATAVKIGLLEEGEFSDRNGNGIADTSADLDGDGNITGSELLPWGQDECVLFEVVLIPGREGTFVPGTYTAGYANDYWNPGPRGMAIDYDGNLWCGTWGTMKYYYIDGRTGIIRDRVDVSTPVAHHPYGAVIDPYGQLWSSGYHDSVPQNNVLFLDPASRWTTNFNLGHRTYGLGIDRNDHLFVAGYDSSVLTRLNVLTFERDWTVSAPYQVRGVVVTDDGDVWTANSGPGTVTRYTNDGTPKSTIPVGNTPTGVTVDADGKVWVVNNGDEYIKRIDPNTDAVDLAKRIIGGVHYGYSDMTGVIARNTTARFGTWTVTHDAIVELTQWGLVSWHALDQSGNGVRIRVRSSNLCRVWSGWEYVTNGVPLTATPPGRYLQVEVALTCHLGDPAPVLYDLTVEPLPQRNADLALTLAGPAGSQTNDHLAAWTITALNRGPDDARGVIVSNWFPAGATLLSVSPSAGSLVRTSGVIRCDVGLLKAGSNLTITATGLWTQVGPFTNLAVVGSYERDVALANNAGVVTGTVLANPCAPVPDGLVGWWPAEGTADDRAGSVNGTLVNGATFAPGKVGRAFFLSGNGAYVEFGRVSPGPTWSLEAWVNLSAIGGGRRVILGCHAECRDWSLLASDGQFGVNIGRSGCVAIVSSGVFAVPGVWYHLVGTCDGTSATIYVNGQAMNTGPVDLNYVGSSASLRIGGSICCGEWLNGLVDEASLYNRPLSAAEVFALYDSQRSGKCGAAFTPTLTITSAVPGMALAVTWPAAAVGFQLQWTAALGGDWQLVADQPALVGDQLAVPISPAPALGSHLDI